MTRHKKNTRAHLRTLLDIRSGHHVDLEYEKDLTDPLSGVAESIGYVQSILAVMRDE